MNRALALARAVAVLPIVRMLPGLYSVGLAFSGSTATPYLLVGTGATLVATNPITVANGANVRIRGLGVTATNAGITCGDTAAPRSKLSLEDVVIQAGDSAAGLVAVNYCDVIVKHADLNLNASTGAAIALTSDATFNGDRVRVTGAMGSVGGFGERMSFQLTNSLIERSTILFSTFDSVGPGSVVWFGYNTLIGSDVDCRPRNFRTNVYANNVVFAPNLPNVVTGTNCRLNSNVLFPQQTTVANNVAADPLFVNAAAADYHLTATSPAVDAAAATAEFPMPTPDLAGTLRPQGPKPDIGAFERIP